MRSIPTTPTPVSRPDAVTTSRLAGRLVRFLPWLSLALGVIAILVVVIWWPLFTPVDRLSFISDAVVFPAAFIPLRGRRRSGLLVLIAGTVIQLPYGLAGLMVGASGGTGGFIGRTLGVLLVLAALWQLRDHYPPRRSVPA